jgi:hypothetical protein
LAFRRRFAPPFSSSKFQKPRTVSQILDWRILRAPHFQKKMPKSLSWNS